METDASALPNRRSVAIPRLAWLTGIAALLVLGVTTWRGAFRSTPVGESYVTNAAMQRSLALRDGSVIDINVDSELSVEFTARERRLFLRKGEAHFQVAHDSARPFVVTSGDVSVRAVGTAFDVRLASKTVEVIVVEGKVQFARGDARSALPVTNASPSLVAGERVQVSRSDP
jgi:transmembrane sensor